MRSDKSSSPVPTLPGPGPRSLSAKILFGAGGETERDGHMDRYARTYARVNSPLLTKDIRDLHPRRSASMNMAVGSRLTTHTADTYTHSSLAQSNPGSPRYAALYCSEPGASQARSGQIKSSQVNSIPTHQQIGILNHFLSARVDQLGLGSTNLVCGYSTRPRRGSARLQKKQQ